MRDNPDHLEILRKINSKPNYTQRELAKELGYSLGKLNYCINALKNKGLVKIGNFKKSKTNLAMSIFLQQKELQQKLSSQ
jgi:DNA-binding MarR family transcriptional regulator